MYCILHIRYVLCLHIYLCRFKYQIKNKQKQTNNLSSSPISQITYQDYSDFFGKHRTSPLFLNCSFVSWRRNGGGAGGLLNYFSWTSIQWTRWISHTLDCLCSCGWIDRVVSTCASIVSVTVNFKLTTKNLDPYCIQQFDWNDKYAYCLCELVSWGYKS